MKAFFADGPLNGQFRDIERTWRYRVPILNKITDWGPGYWEGDGPSPNLPEQFPPMRVGYYEPVDATTANGAKIFVFKGIEK